MEGVVDVERRQGEVDREAAARVRRHGRRGEGIEGRDELRPALGLDLEPGRAGVAAVAEEQRRQASRRRPEIQPAVAPARRPDHVAELGPDDRRAAVVVDEARGDEPDDPDRPRPADDRGAASRPGRGGRRRRRPSPP